MSNIGSFKHEFIVRIQRVNVTQKIT